jgi:hypothetical protein
VARGKSRGAARAESVADHIVIDEATVGGAGSLLNLPSAYQRATDNAG